MTAPLAPSRRRWSGREWRRRDSERPTQRGHSPVAACGVAGKLNPVASAIAASAHETAALVQPGPGSTPVSRLSHWFPEVGR